MHQRGSCGLIFASFAEAQGDRTHRFRAEGDAGEVAHVAALARAERQSCSAEFARNVTTSGFIRWAEVSIMGDGHYGNCPPGTFPHPYQQGETFYLLAQRYHTTVAAIQAANPTLNPYNLQPGMVICIPKHYHYHHCPPGTFPHPYQQGETFYLLAQRYHTTVAAIQAANPTLDPYNLQPGMIICIPKHYHDHHCPPGTFAYTVQQGDTFYLLAQRFHTTVAAIQAANPGVNPYNLQPGMVLCIPSS